MKNKCKFTLLICGFARGGKDTAAEYWQEHFDLTFQSSSRAAAEIFIFEELKDKYGYNDVDECFNDRHNHRAEWFDLICGYNEHDKTRLAREIVEKTGCYVGMRSLAEVEQCKADGVFDLVIWIDAEERVGKEAEDSCDITKACADFIIDNNGTLEEFYTKLERIGKVIFKNTY